MVPVLSCLQFGILFHLVASQDLFLALRDNVTQKSPVSNKLTATVGHDWWVFSFALANAPTLCWDINFGVSPWALQAWECNGHEGQLFYFDAGEYKIQWAGDASQCLDAWDEQEGTQLVVWECNGGPSQQFGYDPDKGSIYLIDSADATRCVDLAGANTASGTPIQVWECNDLFEQSFSLRSGITIRAADDNYRTCFDLSGGLAFNGAIIESWDCNGLNNQQWIFDSDSWAIRWGGDWNYCIDAGSSEPGSLLFLWECNGLDQQKWGYDSSMKTLYLGSSGLCIDLAGGSLDNGKQIEVWTCNGCWNQRWDVVGPVVGMALHSVGDTTATQNRSMLQSGSPGGCPDAPAPSPTPGPGPGPSNVFMPDCSVAASNWPTFNDATSLQNDPFWSSYFMAVYGEIPSVGYPICTGSFTQIPARGGMTTSAAHCVDSDANDGDLVDTLSVCCDPGTSLAHYLYNSKNIGHQVPSNYWVEVQHVHFSQDKNAAWYYLSFGSAIWWNVGNTIVFYDHPEASKGLLGTSCKDDSSHSGTPTECEHDFDNWFKAARSSGYDSIQITNHFDCACGLQGPSSWKHNRLCQTEIIDVNGKGTSGACASSTYKAGWAASQDCNCNNGLKYTNCNGFGIR